MHVVDEVVLGIYEYIKLSLKILAYYAWKHFNWPSFLTNEVWGPSFLRILMEDDNRNVKYQWFLSFLV